ncbi:MAG: EAL domain-containing protein, partial [Chloroflexia bacterium]|nr:EAL domain-containing protein [Chloroflexia bacterium]
AHLGQLGIGLLAVTIAESEPWALLLLLIPGQAVFTALQQHVRGRLRAEEALHGSEANLAEAQRIARLGSWEWDLRTGTQRWSDQFYHIIGADPRVDTPSEALLLRTVHPADQTSVAAARARARASGVSASLDYRLCLPDGGERIVHAQFEAVRDAGGTPIRLLGIVHDITDRKVLEARLAHQAFHDALTGLPNRARVLDRIDAALKRTDRGRPSIAVLFLDLDRFKLINDSFGHEVGDQLLMAVASRLTTCARPGDTVARLGGDEFTVLMEDFGDTADVESMATRIIDALTDPFTINGREVVITTSIGIVNPHTRHDSATAVLRDADVALYHAKDGGRARFAIFDARMGTVIQERLMLEEELRRAVARDEFELLYQPKIELATSRIVGIEALLRWRHPRRGMVRPALFLDVAEETSLILPIGSWVLKTACRQARVWRDTLPNSPVVSVNLSARQFQMLGLVEEIEGYMIAFGLAPGQFRLEISEQVAMADAEATIGILWRLQRIGVSVMIDDFGTGYSSLSHLGRFPVDTLHLDHSFVAGLGRTREASAIAQAVIELARALGLHVVAEGIEREDQLRVLLALGCELGQGDLFSPPVPPERITAFLRGMGADPIAERAPATAGAPLAAPSPSHAGAS